MIYRITLKSRFWLFERYFLMTAWLSVWMLKWCFPEGHPSRTLLKARLKQTRQIAQTASAARAADRWINEYPEAKSRFDRTAAAATYSSLAITAMCYTLVGCESVA